jgi:hypothetical protein
MTRGVGAEPVRRWHKTWKAPDSGAFFCPEHGRMKILYTAESLYLSVF